MCTFFTSVTFLSLFQLIDFLLMVDPISAFLQACQFLIKCQILILILLRDGYFDSEKYFWALLWVKWNFLGTFWLFCGSLASKAFTWCPVSSETFHSFGFFGTVFSHSLRGFFVWTSIISSHTCLFTTQLKTCGWPYIDL